MRTKSKKAAPRLDDFGEHIPGARKERTKAVTDRIMKRPSKPHKHREQYDIRVQGDPAVWTIARLAGVHLLDVQTGFPSKADAYAYREAHRDKLDAAWPALLAATRPVERYAFNRERIGPSTVEWDGDRDAYITCLGLRGVQFGRTMPNVERHAHLHATVLAFVDLASALRISLEDIGFGGKLSLAYGARGHGGNIAAHFEPVDSIINLTRPHGVGCLAHEWAHGLDRALGSGNSLASAAVRRLPRRWPADGDPGRARALAKLKVLPPALRTLAHAVLDSPVASRSRMVDGYRSRPYYSTLPELIARAVESAVVVALADDGGRRNDYLANVHADSPVYATRDEARELVPLVRAFAAEATQRYWWEAREDANTMVLDQWPCCACMCEANLDAYLGGFEERDHGHQARTLVRSLRGGGEKVSQLDYDVYALAGVAAMQQDAGNALKSVTALLWGHPTNPDFDDDIPF